VVVQIKTLQKQPEFCYEKGGSINVEVNKPFNFVLYKTLALQGDVIPLPYIYSAESWHSVYISKSGKYIPIFINPISDYEKLYLKVNVCCDYSSDEEKEIKSIIEKIFCANLDLSSFYKLSLCDDQFSRYVNKLIGLKPYFSMDPFEALIKAIIRQLVRANIARNSISSLVMKFGKKIRINDITFYSFPTPNKIAYASKGDLLNCNVGYKWALIKELSKDILSGDLDIKYFKNINNEKIIEILTEYNGIGYWTSRIFLYDGLKRINAYPIRDITLKKAVSKIFHQGTSISWNEVEVFFSNYSEHVGLASTYLFGAIWLENISNNLRTT